jgi:hypothetical protein
MNQVLVVKRIDPKSLAKLVGAIYFVIGILVGIVVGIGSIFRAPFGGLAFAILSPFLYGVIAYIFGWLTAWLYNFFAARVGGLVIGADLQPGT